MLRRLRIENLAVFEELEVEFGAGLNVISGESGAGKTMLVRALELVLGANADPSLIGPAGDEAYVEAAFDDPVPEALRDLVAEGEELTLARRLRKEGPSRSLAGGRSCSAAQLKDAAGELLSLTGQHAARRLVSPAYQLALLDSSGGLEQQAVEVAELFRAWKEAEKAEEELREALLDGQRRLDLLRHEVELYDRLEPREGEVEELEAEQRRLQAADQLREALAGAEAFLIDDGGASDRLDRALAGLSNVADADKRVSDLAAEIESLTEQVREAGRNARELCGEMVGDQERLGEVEERLNSLMDLRRRFRGASISEIAERIEKSRAELGEIEGGDERLSELRDAREAAESSYREAAAKLRKKRRTASAKLSKSVAGNLGDLGLAEAELIVELEEVEPRSSGIDRAQFLLRANKGLEPAPLDSGASGGELSRLNLALLLAAHNQGRSYLFDEVDSGIGGHTAHSVAEKLAALASSSQLLVITHLAQIAVRGDRNFLISKSSTADGTTATLTPLDDQKQRDAEIARLVGASEDSGQLAADLLRDAAVSA